MWQFADLRLAGTFFSDLRAKFILKTFENTNPQEQKFTPYKYRPYALLLGHIECKYQVKVDPCGKVMVAAMILRLSTY
jgi:hypothetical protein